MPMDDRDEGFDGGEGLTGWGDSTDTDELDRFTMDWSQPHAHPTKRKIKRKKLRLVPIEKPSPPPPPVDLEKAKPPEQSKNAIVLKKSRRPLHLKFALPAQTTRQEAPPLPDNKMEENIGPPPSLSSTLPSNQITPRRETLLSSWQRRQTVQDLHHRQLFPLHAMTNNQASSSSPRRPPRQVSTFGRVWPLLV
ncbi:hypothetical protein LEN26_003572 [Aphanomyces euteiches]|nr:hypothetical protein AeMF1_000940 [Aphanomyces euteiches]KAH9153360.1 hypothetical protein LEN26_003572 [Aphanomyces euteiches]KAH9195383.1 hypothetical protein AeNC1_002627 [Aphanomyces euteiches]